MQSVGRVTAIFPVWRPKIVSKVPRPGALSSAHKAQGGTIAHVLIDMRDAPAPAADPAIGYVALSRAIGLRGLKLLFPVTKNKSNFHPDRDCIALMNWMAKKADETAAQFIGNHNRNLSYTNDRLFNCHWR